MEHEIEFVARALYETEDAGSGWDAETQVMKDEFRSYARKAIALLQDEIGLLVCNTKTAELSTAA